NCREPASCPRRAVRPVAQGLVSARGAAAQAAMNARRLVSRVRRSQPGSALKLHSMYCARSGSFTGGQGHNCGGAWAQPATRRISARRAMWVVYLEIGVALAIALAIVWLTWPRKPK